MNIINLFPIAVLSSPIIMDQSIVNKIIDLCSSDKNSSEWRKNVYSNYIYRDTFIFNSLFNETNIPEQIQKCIDEYTLNILGEKATLKVTQSWINVNPPKTNHHPHTHPNSILSGVLYIQTNDKCGNINIHRPHLYNRIIRNKIENYNEYNFERVWFTPNPCELLIFPSFLQHNVEENMSDIDRISISFNTFYRGNIGSEEDLTYLMDL
jgi:hypothetical protein